MVENIYPEKLMGFQFEEKERREYLRGKVGFFSKCLTLKLGVGGHLGFLRSDDLKYKINQQSGDFCDDHKSV